LFGSPGEQGAGNVPAQVLITNATDLPISSLSAHTPVILQPAFFQPQHTSKEEDSLAMNWRKARRKTRHDETFALMTRAPKINDQISAKST